MDRICVNIWDDYWDDDCIPEGEVQSTYLYIEDEWVISRSEHNKIVKIIFARLGELKIPGVDFELEEAVINFTHLTHERLEMLIPELENSNLFYKGKKLHFYSES